MESVATFRKGQGPVTLSITTGLDLTGFLATSAEFVDESGNSAIISGSASTPANGITTVTTANSYFDEIGYWYVSSYSLDASAQVYRGDPVLLTVAGTPAD